MISRSLSPSLSPFLPLPLSPSPPLPLSACLLMIPHALGMRAHAHIHIYTRIHMCLARSLARSHSLYLLLLVLASRLPVPVLPLLQLRLQQHRSSEWHKLSLTAHPPTPAEGEAVFGGCWGVMISHAHAHRKLTTNSKYELAPEAHLQPRDALRQSLRLLIFDGLLLLQAPDDGVCRRSLLLSPLIWRARR